MAGKETLDGIVRDLRASDWFAVAPLLPDPPDDLLGFVPIFSIQTLRGRISNPNWEDAIYQLQDDENSKIRILAGSESAYNSAVEAAEDLYDDLRHQLTLEVDRKLVQLGIGPQPLGEVGRNLTLSILLYSTMNQLMIAELGAEVPASRLPLSRLTHLMNSGFFPCGWSGPFRSGNLICFKNEVQG